MCPRQKWVEVEGEGYVLAPMWEAGGMSQNDVCADVTMSDPSRVEKDSGRYLERSVWGEGHCNGAPDRL